MSDMNRYSPGLPAETAMGLLPDHYIEQTRSGRIRSRIKIEGVGGQTLAEVKKAVSQGARFILFRVSMFLVFYYFTHTSSVFFRHADGSAQAGKKQVLFIVVSLALIAAAAVFFIWGVNAIGLLDPGKDFFYNAVILLLLGLGAYFPIASLVINLRGGEDVTANIVKYFELIEDYRKNNTAGNNRAENSTNNQTN
ncbi:MAG: hypothetical protein EHM28_13870 [Spirochaetaceae bacterium]|nr:MAG: hypothetical protein EHM28_13870 [Spirochaetaceae bacterium]